MYNFNLKDYTEEIRLISENYKVSLSDAVNRFIENLSTMKEHHEGSGTLNYHKMGQEWGRLPYSVKNRQKAETIDYIVSGSDKRTRSRNRRS